MLKVITGYIQIEEQDIGAVNEIVQNSTSTIEEEREDGIIIDDIDMNIVNQLLSGGYITEEDAAEIEEVDKLYFYMS